MSVGLEFLYDYRRYEATIFLNVQGRMRLRRCEVQMFRCHDRMP